MRLILLFSMSVRHKPILLLSFSLAIYPKKLYNMVVMDNRMLKKRSMAVIIITIITMVAEIYFGIISHSMALTADGFHMGTHSIALLITFFCCILALKHEDKTDKLNALGGYTSAILLGFTSLGIIYESVERFINPLNISFSDAILVAVIGLIVNLLCVAVMGGHHVHFGCNSCEHHHSKQPCENCSHDEHDHNHHHHCVHGGDEVVKGENLNFKAAYLHILADAFTSILAIVALVLGKYCGWAFLDPAMGVVGGLIIAKWAVDLLKSSSLVLLDFNK